MLRGRHQIQHHAGHPGSGAEECYVNRSQSPTGEEKTAQLWTGQSIWKVDNEPVGVGDDLNYRGEGLAGCNLDVELVVAAPHSNLANGRWRLPGWDRTGAQGQGTSEQDCADGKRFQSWRTLVFR